MIASSSSSSSSSLQDSPSSSPPPSHAPSVRRAIFRMPLWTLTSCGISTARSAAVFQHHDSNLRAPPQSRTHCSRRLEQEQALFVALHMNQHHLLHRRDTHTQTTHTHTLTETLVVSSSVAKQRKGPVFSHRLFPGNARWSCPAATRRGRKASSHVVQGEHGAQMYPFPSVTYVTQW
jgi:hypothetical protein